MSIHNLKENDRKTIINENYPSALSSIDKTALFLAAILDAMILSSDKRVRQNARARAIEYHGMLWILDRLVESSLISYKLASEKLQHLIKSNIVYQNNSDLITEMNRRLKEWQKHFEAG